MLKRADLILCALLILAGISLYALLPSGEGETVVIIHQGETVYSANLHEDAFFEVNGDYFNKIYIENSRVFFHTSDCPGRDCVKMGQVSSAGAMLACAPNSTIVLIEGQSEVDGIAE